MSTTANPIEHGGPMYSVWLMPAQPAAARLAAHVAALAPIFGTPAFAPHVTLQGDLAQPLAAVVRATAQVAATMPVQHWPVSGIAMTDVYWRSFYVAFTESPGFAPAQDQLAAVTGTRDALSPFAHLSLAYGPMPDARKLELRAQLSPPLPSHLTFDHLVVALAGKTVGMPSWRALQSFSLLA